MTNSNLQLVVKHLKDLNDRDDFLIKLNNDLKIMHLIVSFQNFFRKRLEKKIKVLYEKNLKDKGVKEVSTSNKLYYALEYLFLKQEKEISIDDIKKYVEKKKNIKLEGGDPLQVRHLGQQYGYNILKGGDSYKKVKEEDKKIKKSCYMLINLKETYKGFCKFKREGKLTKENWGKLTKKYNNQCVNCGAIEGKPLRWNNNKITVLQQGHMDPRKELSMENVIPQCEICNQQYKNKAIFNEKGYVIEFNKKGFKAN